VCECHVRSRTRSPWPCQCGYSALGLGLTVPFVGVYSVRVPDWVDKFRHFRVGEHRGKHCHPKRKEANKEAVQKEGRPSIIDCKLMRLR